MMRFWGVFVVVIFYGIICGDTARVSELGYCPTVSITDAILGFPDFVCNVHHSYNIAVIEGDETSLQKALNLVQSQRHDYVAVMFYASWCPFSRNFRPTFSTLSSLYPSIPHFAIEESTVRPSTLSKYGVHGFPTIFLLNSSMHVRYRGLRSLGSLVHFYSDVTGIKGDPREKFPLEKIDCLSNRAIDNDDEQENCPFSWARSPENLLREETYLALATTFVLLRLLYIVFPYLLQFVRSIWRSYVQVQLLRIRTIWEHPLRYLNRTKQLFYFFKDPRKGSNFQEGAINARARAWASKSLAIGAIGEASTGSDRGVMLGASH